MIFFFFLFSSYNILLTVTVTLVEDLYMQETRFPRLFYFFWDLANFSRSSVSELTQKVPPSLYAHRGDHTHAD